MIEEKDWSDFRKSGMLWFINQTLQLFGWSIVIEISEDGQVYRAYPARVKYRGFSEQCNDAGYAAVTKYLKDNIDSLENDVKEDES